MSLIIDILKPYRIIDRVLDEIFSYAPKIWWLAACRTCPAEIAKTRLKGVETGEFC